MVNFRGVIEHHLLGVMEIFGFLRDHKFKRKQQTGRNEIVFESAKTGRMICSEESKNSKLINRVAMCMWHLSTCVFNENPLSEPMLMSNEHQLTNTGHISCNMTSEYIACQQRLHMNLILWESSGFKIEFLKIIPAMDCLKSCCLSPPFFLTNLWNRWVFP